MNTFDKVEDEKITYENQSILFQLRQWRSYISPRTSIIFLYIIGFLFIGLGTTFFVITGNSATYEIEYDEECAGKENCTLWLNTTREISGRISIAFKLYGFYQNNRRLFESRSYPQMAGQFLDYSGLSICSPLISQNDMRDTPNLYAPCGLMPLSFFNDTYKWLNTSVANFSEDDIAIESDKNLFTGLHKGYNNSIRWLDAMPDFPGGIQNEHFIVWMRTAAMPNFLKLYAKCINCTIPEGNYQIHINMNYPTTMFDGRRAIVLTTTSGLGSGSYFISTAYMLVGGISLIFATIFLLHMLICPRPYADLSYVWNSNHQTF